MEVERVAVAKAEAMVGVAMAVARGAVGMEAVKVVAATEEAMEAVAMEVAMV